MPTLLIAIFLIVEPWLKATLGFMVTTKIAPLRESPCTKKPIEMSSQEFSVVSLILFL